MSTLFLQSEIKNPYLFYQKMIDENPIYWDESNKIWAIYSYKYCVEILNHKDSQIPPVSEKNLNEYALEISRNLARLSNGIQHEIAKETATILFSNMKSIGIDSILSQLFKSHNNNKINWVELICKKLPVLTILKSFNFNDQDSLFIADNIEWLTKIMHPNKNPEDIKFINCVSKEIYLIAENHIRTLSFYENLIAIISTKHNISHKETKSMFVSNLIGLFIQSYDAARGLLSNALLQCFSEGNNLDKTDKIQIQKLVAETIRFDPPIHNTRRIATEDIQINDFIVRKNEIILVVLAAANRDQKQFKNSMLFDIERENNQEHLTFGTGGHMCLAKYFSIHLATEALHYLFSNFKKISILENEIENEPLINARLPKAIWVLLSN
ncbi:MAG: cytochrome P450 [Flavobacterium nitrogenifigens]|uniref:cytochrome P450 n=1 Tax=Flavobacterium nitrogenifigens TaxID=1617283 RepID=UPI0028096B1B|nr:cytochrome P450 [Flavobacterium nitrogenifigens]MDQ8012490.1 cytochrome P450 [Flavobacterium nitrogenifigens]